MRILAGVGARRWTDNISPPRGSRNAASRDLHAETSVRFLFHIVSRRRAHPRETRQPLLRLLPSPPLPFQQIGASERNDENRANFQDHRRTFELFKCGILAAPLILHLGFLGRLERV